MGVSSTRKLRRGLVPQIGAVHAQGAEDDIREAATAGYAESLQPGAALADGDHSPVRDLLLPGGGAQTRTEYMGWGQSQHLGCRLYGGDGR